LPESIEMRQHELLAKVVQHSGAVVALAEFDGSHAHQGSDVPTEALRRRIVQVVRDVRNRKTRILE
jgi:hypothetical protein